MGIIRQQVVIIKISFSQGTIVIYSAVTPFTVQFELTFDQSTFCIHFSMVQAKSFHL